MVNWKKGLKRFGIGVLTFATINSLYFLALAGANSLNTKFTKWIDPSKLEQILVEERAKAGIKDGVSIQVIPYLPTKPSPQAITTKLGEGEYVIHIIGTGEYYRIGSLRHELYHIANGHEDSRSEIMSNSSLPLKIIELIKQFYWCEPNVIISTTKCTILDRIKEKSKTKTP